MAGPFRLQDQQGAEALDPNQLMSLVQGNSIKTGCTPSYSGTGMDIDVGSGTAVVNGSEVSVSAQTVTLANGDSQNPRRDVLAIDSTGTVQAYQGIAETKVPSGATRFEAARPAPDDMSGRDEAVVAEVWVPAGATSLSTSDVRDRRVISSSAALSGMDLFGDLDMNGYSVTNAPVTDLSEGSMTSGEYLKFDGSSLVGGTVAGPPIGGIIPWHKSDANTPPLPPEYAECNGQTLNDPDSPYDGTTLPNLNGNNRFLRGNSSSGGTGGASTVSLSASDIPSHTHTYTKPNQEGYVASGNWDSVFFNSASANTSSVGGDGAHENRPPYFDTVMVMRIK